MELFCISSSILKVLCGLQYDACNDRVACTHPTTWYLDNSYSFVTHLAPSGIHSWWQGTSMSMVAIATRLSSVFVYRCPFLTWTQEVYGVPVTGDWPRLCSYHCSSVSQCGKYLTLMNGIMGQLRIIYGWPQSKQKPAWAASCCCHFIHGTGVRQQTSR